MWIRSTAVAFVEKVFCFPSRFYRQKTADFGQPTMSSSRSLIDQDSIEELKSRAYKRLVETGERERLMQVLRVQLTECGWKDRLTEFCKKVVKEKGVDNVSIDDLVSQVSPVAQKHVPPHVKQDLVKQIKIFLVQELR